MPKGYVLDNKYDAKRAMFRKNYTNQIKQLGGRIKEMGFYDKGAYGIIIDAIKYGIYQNIGNMYNSSPFSGNVKLSGKNKSSLAQDFMSPVELRLNAIAVRRVLLKLEKSRSRSLNEMVTLCHRVAHNVANEFCCLKNSEQEYKFEPKTPSQNVQPVIKKYNKALLCGTLPKGELIASKCIQDRSRLVQENIQLFNKLKELLVNFGIKGKSDRIDILRELNSAYYDMSFGEGQHVELVGELLYEQSSFGKIVDYISDEELMYNRKKLDVVCKTLENLNKEYGRFEVYNTVGEAASKVRQMMIVKDGVLPELFDGFYYAYARSDRNLEIKKGTNSFGN